MARLLFLPVVGFCLALTLPACVPVSEGQGQGQRFYTWVDAEGRAHTSPIPAQAEGKAEPSASTAGARSSGPPPAPSEPKPATAAKGEDGYRAEVFAADETFVDSTELEKRNFNIEGKKKFAYVPDGSGRTKALFFEGGEGAPTLVETEKKASPDRHWARVLDLAAPEWVGLANDCCSAQALKKDVDELRFDQSYRVKLVAPPCLSEAGCQVAVLKLPPKDKDYLLRLRSYVSQPSCRRCMQWPALIVLGKDGRVLRAYASELGGYKSETWHSYASFYYDVDIHHKDDAYVLLVRTEPQSLVYENKKYKGVTTGEIAFSLVQ